MSSADPITRTRDGLTVALRLTPRARRNRVEGVVEDADGRGRLKISVSAPPRNGAANAALIKLLAKEWRLPRTSLTIVAGAGDRNKLLHIAGDADSLADKLQQWRGARHG